MQIYGILKRQGPKRNQLIKQAGGECVFGDQGLDVGVWEVRS